MTTEHPEPRPSWLASTGMVVVLVVAAAMWAYFTVAAVARGALVLGALDGLLLAATVWTLTRTLRRRRHEAG
jgi:hypothetical protein